MKNTAPPDQITHPTFHREVSFGIIVGILCKRWFIILLSPIIFGIVAGLIVWTMPDVYRASVSALPQSQGLPSIAAVLNQFSGVGGVVNLQVPIDSSAKVPTDLYVAILRSREVADNVIESTSFKTEFGLESSEIARRQLMSSSTIKAVRDGLITIEVEDTDPQRAASIANAYVAALTKLTKKLGLTNASQRRAFLERHFQEAKEKWQAMATEAGASVDGQIPGQSELNLAVKDPAILLAQIAAKELELSALQGFGNSNMQEFQWGQQELARMRYELSKYQSDAGREVSKADGLADPNSSSKKVKYYAALTALIAAQLEAARLDEGRDSSFIQVVDKAVAPEFPVKPKRIVLISSAVFFGLFFAVFSVLLYDAMNLGTIIRQALLQHSGASRRSEGI